LSILDVATCYACNLGLNLNYFYFKIFGLYNICIGYYSYEELFYDDLFFPSFEIFRLVNIENYQLQPCLGDTRELHGGFSHGGVFGAGAEAKRSPEYSDPLPSGLGDTP
jgi:hypothetical protein